VNQEDLRYESNIIWRKNLQDIRFVRVNFPDFAYRKGLSDQDRERLERNGDSELIGYADLSDNAPLEKTKNSTGDDYYRCHRRIFFVESGDLTEPYYASNCPSEAVDPLTVKPQLMGRQTERAKGNL
jgi:hypothetical protein